MGESSYEFAALRQAVERCYALRLSTSADFASLSDDILVKLGVTISPSTLKRLWGYVNMNVKPRKWTLDVLSRYAGFEDWRSFLGSVHSSSSPPSSYFNVEMVDSSKLEKGSMVSIGWLPDRELELEFLGGTRFKVIASRNSLLREGDEFDALTIMKGFPLFLGGVWRDGAWTDPYVAGRDGGIMFLKKR